MWVIAIIWNFTVWSKFVWHFWKCSCQFKFPLFFEIKFLDLQANTKRPLQSDYRIRTKKTFLFLYLDYYLKLSASALCFSVFFSLSFWLWVIKTFKFTLPKKVFARLAISINTAAINTISHSLTSFTLSLSLSLNTYSRCTKSEQKWVLYHRKEEGSAFLAIIITSPFERGSFHGCFFIVFLELLASRFRVS